MANLRDERRAFSEQEGFLRVESFRTEEFQASAQHGLGVALAIEFAAHLLGGGGGAAIALRKGRGVRWQFGLGVPQTELGLDEGFLGPNRGQR